MRTRGASISVTTCVSRALPYPSPSQPWHLPFSPTCSRESSVHTHNLQQRAHDLISSIQNGKMQRTAVIQISCAQQVPPRFARSDPPLVDQRASRGGGAGSQKSVCDARAERKMKRRSPGVVGEEGVGIEVEQTSYGRGMPPLNGSVEDGSGPSTKVSERFSDNGD